MGRLSPGMRIGPMALVLATAIGPVVLPWAAFAEPMRATVQQILDRPELFIDARQARVKDVADEPQRISTRNSRAQVLFSSGAAGRINRQSVLQLGNRCFLLEQGQVLVSGRQSACTRSLRLSVRGTNFIVEAFDNGDAAVTSLQGDLEVETLRDGEATAAAPQLVSSGQRLRLLLALGLSTVIDLTPSDYRSILEGPLFRGFDQRLPDQEALEEHLKAKVPGVSLPAPTPPARADSSPGFPFGFNFGFGFSGDGDRPSSRPKRETSPRQIYPQREESPQQSYPSLR